MKTIKILLVTLLFPTFLMAQNATSPAANFFDKHLGSEGYTTVKITKKMFDLISSIELDLEDEEDQLAYEMIQNIQGINVLASNSEDNPTQLRALFNELESGLPNNYYEPLVIVDDEETKVRIMVKDAGKSMIDELLVLVNDDEDLALISIVGKIDLKQISKLSSSININGMEHLAKIDEQCGTTK